MADQFAIARPEKMGCALHKLAEDSGREPGTRDVALMLNGAMERGSAVGVCAGHEPLVLENLPRGMSYKPTNIGDEKGIVYRGAEPKTREGVPPPAAPGVSAKVALKEHEEAEKIRLAREAELSS